MSEVTSLVAGLIVGNTDDTESITDSVLDTCSVLSEATSTGVSKSSRVINYVHIYIVLL